MGKQFANVHGNAQYKNINKTIVENQPGYTTTALPAFVEVNRNLHVATKPTRIHVQESENKLLLLLLYWHLHCQKTHLVLTIGIQGCARFPEILQNVSECQILWSRRRSRGGGPGGAGPPLTPGFEAPKLSIFGPYLIFP